MRLHYLIKNIIPNFNLINVNINIGGLLKALTKPASLKEMLGM